MSAFIERCRDVNGVLNAIVEDRFIAALEDAKNVDQFISSGQKTEEQLKMEFPLLGVPITVKEACKVEGEYENFWEIMYGVIKNLAYTK